MQKKARLEQYYLDTVRPELQKRLNFQNVMEIPKIEKIVLNVGVGKEAVSDSKILQPVIEVVTKIAGQKPVKTVARKSIAGFKLREGMPIGVKVTLRKKNMYEFLDRLITAALPAVRDLQGVSTKLDGQGNYNLGIKEWTIFSEVGFDINTKTFGLNIAIHTSTKNDTAAFELLKLFGMPFKKAH